VNFRTAIFVLSLCELALTGSRKASVQEVKHPSAADQPQDASQPKQEPPTQPIPYSHKKHLALGLECEQCHPNAEPGDRMTFPAISKCMACHSTIAKDKPSIQKLTEFSKSKQPIPGVRIYVVSSWVYWSHRAHLEARMSCQMCHGEISEMDVMAKVSKVTTMAGCIECHRKNEANTGCQFCHEDK
jgi:hypothetical protein